MITHATHVKQELQVLDRLDWKIPLRQPGVSAACRVLKRLLPYLKEEEQNDERLDDICEIAGTAAESILLCMYASIEIHELLMSI